MELHAYVTGDVAVVTQLLSQVAMVMTSDDFATGVKLFALIGILMGLFGALMKGGKLSAEIFVLPLFVIAFGIVPKVDLVIEDAKGGISRVDDLPVIAAAPVSLVTTVGHSLNNLLTDNLGLDDYAIDMENGHITAVRAPVAISELITDTAANADFATLPGGIDITRDVPRFMRECVGVDIRRLSKVPADIYNGNVNTAFVPTAYGWTVATSSGNSLTCDVYHDNIMAGIEDAAFETGLKEALNAHYGRYENTNAIGDRYVAALDDLVTSRTDFYKAVVFGSAIEKARADYTRAGGGGSSYAALQDAMDQRRWKNFGAAAMVFETLQYLITFIEAWTLCILPLIALLFVAGASGLKLGIKYFWLLVWTQLWYPTILITIGILDAYAKNAATSVYSVSELASFLEEMYRLQDVGYLFLSLTTMLSIFLIYGTSAYLAGSFQTDMTGAQHYDPKKNAPDTLSREPFVKYESAFGHTRAGGYEGNVDSLHDVQFTIDSQRAEGVSNAQLTTFAATGSRGASTSTAVGARTEEASSAAQSTEARETEEAAVREGQSEGLGGEVESGQMLNQGMTLDQRMATQVDGGASASAGGVLGMIRGALGMPGGSAGGQAKGSPIDAQVAAKLSNAVAAAQTESAAERIGADESLSTSQRVEATHNESQAATSSESQQDNVTAADTTQVQDTATQSQQETETDSVSESLTEQTSASRTGRVTIGGIPAANRIAADPELMTNLVRDASLAGISNYVDHYMVTNRDSLDHAFMGRDAEDAKYAFSALMVMQNMGGSPYAGQANAAERMEALNAMGDEYLHAATFAEGRSQYGDARDEDAATAPDADLADRIDEIHARSALSQEGVREDLAAIDPNLDPRETFERMRELVPGKLEELTEGKASGVFTEMRDEIMARYSEDAENAQPFAQAFREHGVRGYLRGLVGSANDVDVAHNADVTNNAIRRAGGLEDVTAKEVLNARMQDFGAAGINIDDTPGDESTEGNIIAEYMALTQLQIGTGAAADGVRAEVSGWLGSDAQETYRELRDDFQERRADLIDRHPELANENLGEPNDIGALAVISAGSDLALRRTFPAAEMLGQLSAEEQRYEAATGNQVSSDGSSVDWTDGDPPLRQLAPDSTGIAQGIRETAAHYGIDELDLATAISYETAGNFDPVQPGPTTQHGQHRGFIQWGEPQAREHGVDWNDPVNSQLGADGAIVSYLRERGVEAGDGLLEIYSAINAGGVGEEYYARSDAHNGGMPGTVREKVASAEMAEHRQNAERYLYDEDATRWDR